MNLHDDTAADTQTNELRTALAWLTDPIKPDTTDTELSAAATHAIPIRRRPTYSPPWNQDTNYKRYTELLRRLEALRTEAQYTQPRAPQTPTPKHSRSYIEISLTWKQLRSQDRHEIHAIAPRLARLIEHPTNTPPPKPELGHRNHWATEAAEVRRYTATLPEREPDDAATQERVNAAFHEALIQTYLTDPTP